jgi:hypothetical protein
VVPLQSVPDVVLEKQIAELVASDPRFVAAGVTAKVEAGAVSLQGMFLGPQDILDLKHRVASLVGVRSLWIDAALVAASR